MIATNTYRNLAILGYGNEMVENLDFKEMAAIYSNSAIVFTDDVSGQQKAAQSEDAFNFLCQPVLVSTEGAEFSDLYRKEENDEIKFL